MDGFPIEMSVGTADVFVSKKTVKLTSTFYPHSLQFSHFPKVDWTFDVDESFNMFNSITLIRVINSASLSQVLLVPL